MFRLGLQIFQGLKPQALAKSIKHAQNYTCICSYPNLTKNFAPERNFQTTCDLYNAQEVCLDPYIIKKARLEDRSRILDLLRETLFVDEPLLKSAGFSENVPSSFEDYIMSTIVEGTSLLAVLVGTEKLVGVVINGIAVPRILKQPPPTGKNKPAKTGTNPTDNCTTSNIQLQTVKQPNKDPDIAIENLFGLYAHIDHTTSLWQKYKIDKVWDIRILATDKKYRRKGIALALAKKSIEAARLHHFRLLKMDCTNLFIANLAEALELQCVYMLTYYDYQDKNKRPIFDPEIPHTFLKVYIQEL